MEEHHSFCNLFGNTDASTPWKRDLRFMKNVEKSSSLAILTDNVEVVVVLGHPYQSN